MRLVPAISSLTLAVALLGRPAAVRAQPLPAANVLRTSTTGDVEPALAEGFDRLVRARLAELHAVSVTGSLPLDLTDLQLALGCEGETDECLGAIAGQAGVEVLVLPNVTRAAGETIVSLTVFDARATPKTRRAMERLSGADASAAAMAAVPTLLEHLFPTRNAVAPTVPTEATPAHHGLSPWPVVTLGLGIAALAVGVGFGIATNVANDAYGTSPTRTSADVDAALAHLDEASTDATVADVMLVLGGVATAVGLAWLFVDLFSGGSPPSHADRTAILLPAAAHGGGLLVLTGSL